MKQINIVYEKGRQIIVRKDGQTEQKSVKEFSGKDSPDWLKDQGCKKYIYTSHGFGLCKKGNEFHEVDLQEKRTRPMEQKNVDSDLIGIAVSENEFYSLPNPKQQISLKVKKGFWDEFD